MRRRQRRLFTVWGVLSFVLVVSALWIGLLSVVAHGWQGHSREAYARGYEAGKSEVVVIEDEPVYAMPLFLQGDLRWASTPYADGTIATHGCGLTCAAMAMTFITGDYVSPDSLAIQSGDAFVTDGVNDPDKICQWLVDNYGVEWSGEKWTLDDGLALVDEGYVVIASMSGKLCDRTYGGHNVLVYAHVDGGYLVRDPDDAANSNKVFTYEELSEAAWTTFDGIRCN